MDVNFRSKVSNLVSFCSFGFCVFFYIVVAICGYSMFGEAIQSQFTLIHHNLWHWKRLLRDVLSHWKISRRIELNATLKKKQH